MKLRDIRDNFETGLSRGITRANTEKIETPRQRDAPHGNRGTGSYTRAGGYAPVLRLVVSFSSVFIRLIPLDRFVSGVSEFVHG